MLEDLPLANRSGHQTYLREVTAMLVDGGAEVDLLITGQRFEAPIVRWSGPGAPGIRRVVALNAVLIHGHLVVYRPLALLKAIWRYFKLDALGKPFRRRLASTGGVTPRTVRIGRWLSAKDVARIARLVSQAGAYTSVFVDSLFRTRALDAMPKDMRRVLISHDVVHERCDAFIAAGMNPVPLVTEEAERALLGRYTSVLAISPNDARRFEALATGAAVVLAPQPFSPVGQSRSERQPTRILFIGTRGAQNTEGLKWFLSTVWVELRRTQPAALLDVVGTVSDEIDEGSGIVRHGRVARLEPIASRCSFAINPVLVGSGMKIKVLDYLALQLPVIATNAGAAGFDTSEPDGPLKVVDDPAAMAAELSSWMGDPKEVEARRAAIARHLLPFERGGIVRRLQSLA